MPLLAMAAYLRSVLWRHKNASCWHCDILFDNCPCKHKSVQNWYSPWISSLNIDFPSLVVHLVACESIVLFVCFVTKSFLTYSFFPTIPALSTISRYSACHQQSWSRNCEVRIFVYSLLTVNLNNLRIILCVKRSMSKACGTECVEHSFKVYLNTGYAFNRWNWIGQTWQTWQH